MSVRVRVHYCEANQPTMEDIFSGKAFKDAAEEEKKAEKKTGKEARAEKRQQ